MGSEARGVGRCFLVGCSRSGTTLLLSFLGAHPSIFGVFETHFFSRARPRIPTRLLGIPRPWRARAELRKVAAHLGQEAIPESPGFSLSFRRYAQAFVSMLDEAARNQGKTSWVEKSPNSLFHIDHIERMAQDAKFIHIVRDGRDVVASWYKISQRDPIWRGRALRRQGFSLSKPPVDPVIAGVVNAWNDCAKISLSRSGNGRHLMVSYQELTRDTQSTLASICTFMGVAYDPAMMRHQEGAREVVGSVATSEHMKKILEPLQDTRLHQFYEVFNDEERRYITEHLTGAGEPARIFPGFAQPVRDEVALHDATGA